MARWLLVAVLVLAACSAPPPEWAELPPPAPGARVLAMVPVDGGVLVLGSVPGPEGRAPAAWMTADGRGWRPVALAPHSAYAFQAELASAGAANGQVTVLGQAFGGAHGNPRMTVWSGSTESLTEYPQPFELFGGPHAIAVNAAAAGLLVGQWDEVSGRYGAAVWTTADGRTWRRQADDPALASAPGEQTSAVGVTSGPSGFLVAGGNQRGADLLPLAWVSPDGQTWRRLSVPGTGSTAQRAACDANGCVLFGASAGARPQALCWQVGLDGSVAAPHPGPAGSTVDVKQASLGAQAFVTVSADSVARLYSVSRDCASWTELPLPAVAPEAYVAAVPAGLLLATTAADRSGLWWRKS
ncbi:hypothetical protein FPZ12_045180 [Amycolatopsis acidicola]|uniref:Exo-alpha-sialidase n=1 Tax=Amycolatopsis acidicola TaxID=2596893 RepID=A0A5N0UI39_9PSEU|nr:hypothetical protein [Amycolatopsis acidicola]KAA9147889.1 hypothetical protein FPZ12_045180 [Amycolatopsis acidicola]